MKRGNLGYVWLNRPLGSKLESPGREGETNIKDRGGGIKAIWGEESGAVRGRLSVRDPAWKVPRFHKKTRCRKGKRKTFAG